jgi:hypothetical protein
MLRVVRGQDYDDPYEGARRRARHDDPPARPERDPRSSVLVSLARTLALAAGFASVAFLSYLAGQTGMLNALFAPASTPVMTTAEAPAPTVPQRSANVPAPVPAQAAQPPIPNVQSLVLLIRNAVVAVHQANQSGNYAVLRALAAPDFQQHNTAEGLSQVFSSLRAAGVDLGQVTAVNPRLYSDPAIDNSGFLRLAGFIPLGEARADFEMAFQLVNGRWRLFGIGVHPPRGPAIVAAKAASPKAIPEDATLVAMIRNAVLALNQANATGDYSVLHGISAASFQTANSPAKLSDAFSAIRKRGLDLAPVAVIDPRLFRPAAIDRNGYLRLAGYFPSQPEQVNFDLVFQFEGGAWRLFGLGVDTGSEPPATAAAP